MRYQAPGTGWVAGLSGLFKWHPWPHQCGNPFPTLSSPLPSPGSEVEQGALHLSLGQGSGQRPLDRFICTFVLDVKLSLLPKASEGSDASAWANQDARHLGVSRQVEARGTGQRRNRSLAVPAPTPMMEPRVAQAPS